MSIAQPEKALENNPHMQKHDLREDDLNFEKIQPITSVDTEKEFEVRYNDLDVNRHANNGNYIVWAFEPLDYDFKYNNKPKTIDMAFKKEAKYGERLISQVQYLDSHTTVHALKNASSQEDLCVLKCKWE